MGYAAAHRHDTPTLDERELDAIEMLGDEIATLSAHIHAATHRLLVLIAEFDRRRGWESAGHANCACWLAARTGIDPGAAREKVRAARALERLPRTSAAMARGELSFSQVRALSRAATPENEAELLALARGTTAERLERVVRAWKKLSREDEVTLERERFESRSLSVFPDDDGMYVVRGRLPAEAGALLMRAIEAASDALYREEPPGGNAHSIDTDRAAAQRRADAVALLAERALAAGFGTRDTDDGPVSGTRAERYQVVLHVEPSTLAVAPHADGSRSELEDGTRVSAETSRRIACDAGVVRVTHAGDGAVLDVGRRRRTVPPAVRRALEVRDRGCRFPGCGRRFTDAHHVTHWADGGATSLANCLLLCARHHRLVHEGRWRVDWWGTLPVFRDPHGREHFDGRWRPPRLARDPVAALVHEHHRRGIAPDALTAGARWRSESDIPGDVYFRALEAG